MLLSGLFDETCCFRSLCSVLQAGCNECHNGSITSFAHHQTPGMQMTQHQQMERLCRSDRLCSLLDLLGTSKHLLLEPLAAPGRP